MSDTSLFNRQIYSAYKRTDRTDVWLYINIQGKPNSHSGHRIAKWAGGGTMAECRICHAVFQETRSLYLSDTEISRRYAMFTLHNIRAISMNVYPMLT